MEVAWAASAWEDYARWQAEDADIARKINELVKDIRRTPFTGLGKPEPLRGEYAGWWSRRITTEHRLVYRVEGTRGKNQRLLISQCRYHY
jgi:toxin YoeB